MRGKAILVTGAAQGVGRQIALDCARAGAAALILCDRQGERGEATAAEIRASGTDAVFIHADLAEEAAAATVFSEAIAAFGRIDSLVNAAGVTDRASVSDATTALWDRVFAINARAPTFLMQAVIRHLRQRQAPGTILNILSMNAYGGTPELAIYAASKAALELLTRNAAHARRFARMGINGIDVSWVDTPAEPDDAGRDPRPRRSLASRRSNGRQPMEVGFCCPSRRRVLALFLLGDASFPMTGTLVDQELRALSVRD